jgi:hypothetical protein
MQAPLEQAKDIVLEFTRQVNDWETKMYILSRIELEQFVSEEKKKLVEGQTIDSLNRTFYKIFEEFCTKKERKFGGQPHSYGKPTKYSGICSKTIIDTNQVRTNRIEIIAKSDYFLETIYKFVLLKKLDGWKIDSLKIKRGEKWENTLL